jgi:predicted ABC-type transport system involved in lysophospholipase L1 biosynthesis ATPase subunit
MSAKIVVTSITKSFSTDKGSLNVVGEIDFAVDDGEFVAIVGVSNRTRRP